MKHDTKWAAVAWAPYSRRSEMFARELGGKLHCIHYLRFQYPLHAPCQVRATGDPHAANTLPRAPERCTSRIRPSAA